MAIIFFKYQSTQRAENQMLVVRVWLQLRLPGSAGGLGLPGEEELKESERQQQLFEGAVRLQLGPACIAGSSSR